MAIIQTRVRLKKDTTEEWEDNGSLVLLDGEMAIEAIHRIQHRKALRRLTKLIFVQIFG